MNTKGFKNLVSGGWFRRLMLCTLCLAVVAGCAGTPQTHPPQPAGLAPTETAPPSQACASQPAATTAGSVEAHLRAHVQKWHGTPHKMGGNSLRGVDCSGFVQQVYQDVFSRSIARTTALQVKSGRPVELSGLCPGDLVFFKPPYKVRHVGIYLGQGEFAHASYSKGVMISNLAEDYWRRCYWTARRY